MKHARTIVSIVLMSVIASARAEVLYSIDADCNTLVRIDSTTGAVAVVGVLDGSDRVDVRDLLIVLAAWGPCACCRADVDGDGRADVRDLLVVLAAWGVCPP